MKRPTPIELLHIALADLSEWECVQVRGHILACASVYVSRRRWETWLAAALNDVRASRERQKAAGAVQSGGK